MATATLHQPPNGEATRNAALTTPIYEPNGTLRTWISDRDAAARRIIYQETGFINTWFQQNAISWELRTYMLGQLTTHCGGRGIVDHMVLYEEGSQLVQRLSSLSYDEQIRCFVSDLNLRQAILIVDQADPNLVEFRYPEGGYQPKGVHCSGTDEGMAALRRREINQQQIANLNQMLSRYPPEALEVARSALKAQQSGEETQQDAPVPTRLPLASLPANVEVKSAAAADAALKRKRQDSTPRMPAEVISFDDDESESEETLHGQVEFMQARIAAIRARTSQEDQLMPTKKPKAKGKKENIAEPAGALPQTSQRAGNAVQGLKASYVRSPSLALQGAAGHPGLHPTCVFGAPLIPSCNARDIDIDILNHPATKAAGLGMAELPRLLKFKQMLCTKDPLASEGALNISAVAYYQRREMQKAEAAKHVAPATPSDQQPAYESVQAPRASQRASIKQEAWPARPQPAGPVVDLTMSSSPLKSSEVPSQQQPEPPTPAETEPALCYEQQQVVDLIMQGHNVFYTGSAGCGKSTVLKAFVSQLRAQGKTVKIVAPTGKAALDINGSTTWTYAGWTPGHMKKPLEDLIRNGHGKFVRKRFKDTDVLVIDEISMVENHLLTRLSAVMKAARGSYDEFGGVQLVVTGDFCQLPPVKPFEYCITCGKEQYKRTGPNGETLYRCRLHGDCNDDDKWAFRSAVWEACNFKHVNLTNIHRQSDEVFIKVLQKLRVGNPLNKADRAMLLDHECDARNNNAVRLFAKREEVRRVNAEEFDRLKTAKRGFHCLDYFQWNEKHGNLEFKGKRSHDGSLEALREHRLETLVEFKAGMLVVLLVNLDIANGLVNGSQGKVIGFEPYAASKLPKASVSRDEGGGSFSRGFGSSQRGGSSKKPRRGREPSPEPEIKGELRGEHAVLREGQIKDFILQDRNQNRMWPIVEFDNGIRRTIYADCQINELGDEEPYTLLARTQIPLVAAWAMTIHKSQGMTLNRVIVDLGKSFEEGQEYVALSRARSLGGLKVLSLGNNAGKGGNEQVRAFLREKFGIK